jgi:HAD superfamily phosphatase (TIGR01668 family)
VFSWQEYKAVLRDMVTPNFMCESVEDIPLEKLFQKGFNTLLLDVDNTVLRMNERQLSLQKLQWLNLAQSMGFRAYFVSNNSSHRRIFRVSEQSGIKGIHFSMKPLTLSIRAFAKENGIIMNKSILVGDKLFTDVLAGNWLRCYTVLVDPLNKKTSLFKTIQRDVEMGIIRLFK